MSKRIRRYVPDGDWFEDAEPLAVTAVTGSPRLWPSENGGNATGHGRSVQLSIGSEFTILTEAQAQDLIASLARRLGCDNGFAATDPGPTAVVKPSGNAIQTRGRTHTSYEVNDA